MVPRTVLTRSGPILVNAVRPINTVQLRTAVNNAGLMKNVINNSYSTARWPFNKITAANNSNFTKKVNIVKDTRVNTARPKAVISAIKGNKGNVVKASAYWVWRPKHKVLDHARSQVSNGLGGCLGLTGTDPIFSIMKNYWRILWTLEVILKGGEKLLGKVVSQMCEKKYNVLFTDTEYVVMSPDLRSRPNWLFDIDALTNSMNYKPVVAGNQSNGNAGTKACDNADDDEDVGAEADMNNLDAFMPVSPIPTTRIHKDHPVEQIIRDLNSTPQTRRMTKNLKEHEAMQDELLQFKLQKVWTLVDLPNGKRAIGTKWVYRNKKDERGIVLMIKQEMVAKMDVKSAFLYGKIEDKVYVYQPPGFEDPDFPDRFYKVENALYGLHQAPKAWAVSEAEGRWDFYKPRQCKKQTMVANSITKAEYVAASSCCGQVLWIKNQLLDYRDSNEKKLIQVTKIHTDKNVADLLTKSFNFADSHNMVAFLAKPTESDGFEQILDFLNANPIKRALMVNPIIYTSCIEQFWDTAKVKTVNGEVQLQALVDGKKVIIIETSVRRDLQLEDAEGIECLPNADIFRIHCYNGMLNNLLSNLHSTKAFFSSQWKFWIHTILQCLSAKSTAWNEFSSTIASAIICLASNQKFNFSKYIFESMGLEECGIVDKTVKFYVSKRQQNKCLSKENASSEERVKKLEKEKRNVFNGEEVFVAEQKITLAQALAELRSAKPKIVVQEPVQSTTTIAPSTIPKAKSITFRDPSESTTRTTLTSIPSNIKDKGKAKMIEPEKPLKMKEQIRLDEELAFKLQAEEEEQARLAREKAEKVKEANISWDNVQAMIEADRLLAKRLQAREQEELTDEEKARLFVELLEKRKKHFAALRAQEKRNKPPTKAQKKSTMSTYLKHMAGYKQSQLKNKSFAEIQKLFDKAMTRMAQESSLKRAGDKLEQEKEKKQKIDDDQEEVEMKKLIKVVPDEEEIAIDAIPLATKPPSIVDWKIVKEGKISLFQIIRANGSSKRYSLMIQILRDFDREDLETLWELVKAKHGSTRPKEGYERVLWVDKETITYIVDMFCDTLKIPVETPEQPFIEPGNLKFIQSFLKIVGYQGLVDKVTIKQKKPISITIPLPSDDRERDEIHEATQLSLALHKTVKLAEEQENMAAVEEQLLKEDVEKIVEGEDEDSYASKFADSVFLNKEDTSARLEPESHKENPEIVDDDDDDVNEKKDDKKDDDNDDNDDDNDNHYDQALVRNKRTGSSEIRTPPRSPRTDLSSDKTISQELIATISPTPTTTSQDRSKSKPTSSKTKEKGRKCLILPNNLVLETNELTKEAVPRMVNDAVKKDRKISTTNVPELILQKFVVHAPKIIEKLFKTHMKSKVIIVHPTTSTSTSTFADLQHQLYLNMRTNLQDQVDDLELWDVLKRSKTSESARQEQQQEWDTWVEDTVIDKDEVIPEDKTPELIEEFQNVDKHVPTIFDHERMKDTLRDILSKNGLTSPIRIRLVLKAMTSDHNSSELGIYDHNNELSCSKLVPKFVPLAYKTATSRQELELLFHHHITMLRSYALSWKPCQGDSLNLPDHRIHKDGDGDASFQLESNSLPHAHAQTTKTYYKHQDSRIMKAQELKTKTSAQTLIYKIFLQRYQVYQGRLLAIFQDDAKYEHVGQDTRSQGGKDDQDGRIKI
ncbi:ribonuclease H-like domain-containing protein [Tanacetum coccineum]